MKIKWTIMSLLAAFIFSCAGTSTKVKFLKPAEMDVGSVRKVAVLDFYFKGNWDFGKTEDEPDNLKKLGLKILGKAIDKKNTEKKLDPENEYPGKIVSDMFVAKLVNNGYYTVIERDQIAKILEEQALSLSGVVEDSTAIEVGKLIGAEALIMGSGSYSVKDEGKWEEYKENKKEKERYEIERKVSANLTYRIVDISSGKVIGSKTNSASNEKSQKILGISVPSIDSKYKSTGDNISEAHAGLPDWRPIVDEMVNTILNKSVQQIAPYYVQEEREIEKGDSEQMKAAMEYAKRSLWEDAREIWEMVLQDKSSDREDKIAATYNMGLYYEVSGELDLAEELFDRSFKISGDSKYLDSKARIKKRKKELKRLEKQDSLQVH